MTPSDTEARMLEDAAVAGLAHALQDSENTCKMGDLSETDRKRYFERATLINKWLNTYGYQVVKSDAMLRARNEAIDQAAVIAERLNKVFAASCIRDLNDKTDG